MTNTIWHFIIDPVEPLA